MKKDMSTFSIIFDLDGTLIDSLAGITTAMNSVLAEAGYPIHQADDYRHMVGDGVSWLITRSLPDGEREPERIHEFVDRYKLSYEKVWPRITRPFPGIPDTLEALQSRGIPLAILSNKSHDVTLRMVSALLPSISFHSVLGQRVGHPIKPDPTCALNLSRSMGSKAEHTCFVGDSGVDMKTAVNAGMVPVGVDWGMRTRKELEAAGARVVVCQASQLLGLL